MLSATSNSTRNRSPFTPSQWQELEHQALIYKYMVSGVPIPPELIFNVKRSLESSLTSRLFPHQSLGWGFQVGYGRKQDPEPGRCKRTDGKKWRCSKEAYPDSKYCEKHMHRGRNRSRKPVELCSSSTNITTTSTVTNNSLSMNRNFSNSSNFNTGNNSNSSPSASSYSFSPLSSPMDSNPFLYSHSSSSSRPQNNTTHNLFLDSSSTSHIDKDYRYYSGMRDGGDGRSFFPGNSRNLQDSYGQLTMNNYSQSQFENLGDNNGSSSEDQQQQHCFVLGTDFKSSSSLSTRSIKLEKESETQKSLHHFFGEWPPKNSDSWLDLSSTSRLHTTDS